MSTYEIKNTSFELKEINEDGTIIGYGAVFDVKDNGGDIITKGAFSRSLNTGKKVKMLWQHKRDEPIGVWNEINSDDNGLLLKGQLALETQQGRETYALLKMGALEGLSIGFIPVQVDFDEKGTRLLQEVNLKEVSIVTFPMNEEANVLAVKSDQPELNIDQLKEVSEFIRSIVNVPEEIKEDDELKHISDDIADILGDTKGADLANVINSLVK